MVMPLFQLIRTQNIPATVGKRLQTIFDFRRVAIEKKFGKMGEEG
jgi:hypothetical protein